MIKKLKILPQLYSTFLSERTKNKIEKLILYIALIGFFVHLTLIYLYKFDLLSFHSASDLFKNPISAIYTPFSFILIYEVYLLIYYLPKSFTTYIIKQYEIITLIIIRKLFKDLSSIELTSNWFEIKGDLQFTYDILASIILFYLIFQIQKHGKLKLKREDRIIEQIDSFIKRKKVIAIFLVPTFFTMAAFTFANWISKISFTDQTIPDFGEINNLFFDEFFTVLILVDVVILLISFFYTDKFHKIIRNSGFIVSTILIRMSFGVSGFVSTVLIIAAVLFGWLVILIHNKYERHSINTIS